MAESTSPLRHRLELLERTIYALQAQQRLLEYRVQYIEAENKSLIQKAESIQPRTNEISSGGTSLQPFSQATPSVASPTHGSYASELQVLAQNSLDNAVVEQAKGISSISLLDEPSPLTTPSLTPSRRYTSPKNNGLRESYSALTPSSAAASVFQPKDLNRPSPTATAVPTPVAVSPLSCAVDVSPANSAKSRDPTVVPWDGTIAWKFINLFNNKKEEQAAMLNSMDYRDWKDEYFFHYGLRYIPKPTDRDVYRTIRIENLPDGTTLDKVLAQVYYGDIFSADLLNTFPITGYHTARLVFLHQKAAEEFCKHAKRKGFMIGGVRAQVALERTATYPVGAILQDAVRKQGCTRCVTIEELPETLLDYVEAVISQTYLMNSVESYSKGYDGDSDDESCKVTVSVQIRFHSMRAAFCAYAELNRNIFLRNCILKYDKDPCNTVPK